MFIRRTKNSSIMYNISICENDIFPLSCTTVCLYRESKFIDGAPIYSTFKILYSSNQINQGNKFASGIYKSIFTALQIYSCS